MAEIAISSESNLNLFSKTSTFMSIDVVGSTSLKSGESDQDIIYTFLSYHKLIKELSYQHHGEVIHITGDGMMCRFQNPEDAAQMCRSILARLNDFNKRQNHLAKPLTVRIGVHQGEVYENASLSSGELISKTLDVAAKLQQGAPANRARFSESAAAPLPRSAFAFQTIGWNVDLQINVFELRVETVGKTAVRKIPDPVRVLVIEPELDELLTLRRVLWSRQHDSLPVYSAAQAGLCLTAWDPHLILCSVDLPWDSGWDLLDRIRNEKKLSQVPVLVMSGQSTGQTVERSLSKGGNGFLRKPLDEKQISKRMDIALREFYL